MEKFALLNLLNALNSLAPKTNESESAPPPVWEQPQNAAPSTNAPAQQNAPTPQPVPPQYQPPNFMQNVLNRHEEIANRIKNKK